MSGAAASVLHADLLDLVRMADPNRPDPLRRSPATGSSPRPSIRPVPAGDGLRDVDREVGIDVARALTALRSAAVDTGFANLASDTIELLRALKEASSARLWRDVILPAARSHPLAELVHECPFTRHSYARPRGYPGDAGLLDFVYRHREARPAMDAASPAGRSVMEVTLGVSACEAVRWRRSYLARAIDEVAGRREGAQVLALACGHLREAEDSQALRAGDIRRLVAADQDGISLERVRAYRENLAPGIEPRMLTVRNFLLRAESLGRFDLVYAAGLYDYLDARLAARLTRALFGQLRTGGRLLIPNFRTGVREEAYMEAYMDWYLIYRSREEIEAFADEIAPGELAGTAYFEDDHGRIGYLELEKA